MREETRETRRYFDLVAEWLAAKIELLAEGVIGRIDAVEQRSEERDRELAARFEALLGAGYRNLDRRVGRLDGEVFGEAK